MGDSKTNEVAILWLVIIAQAIAYLHFLLEYPACPTSAVYLVVHPPVDLPLLVVLTYNTNPTTGKRLVDHT